jgi:hypothetical protein
VFDPVQAFSLILSAQVLRSEYAKVGAPVCDDDG